MDKKTLARLRGLGYEFDSAYDDMAEMIEKSRIDDAESKKRREEAKLKVEKEKIKKEEEDLLNNENLREFGTEDFFYSHGENKKLERYYQALHYDDDTSENTPYIYGMDCNACCMMYFLQSYGLIPPNMTRKEFEYLLTPLNPPDTVKKDENDVSAYSENKIEKSFSDKRIVVNGRIVKYLERDIFEGLFLKTALFLKGIKGYGAIFPQEDKGAVILNKIANKFYQLASEVGYIALQKSHLFSAILFRRNDRQLVINCYQPLVDGGIDKSYFKDGNTIFVGLDSSGNAPGHYCIVVAPKILTKK